MTEMMQGETDIYDLGYVMLILYFPCSDSNITVCLVYSKTALLLYLAFILLILVATTFHKLILYIDSIILKLLVLVNGTVCQTNLEMKIVSTF